MTEVNEKTTSYLSVSFYDKAGTLANPTAATFKIHDGESGKLIAGPTALAATASQEIILSGSLYNKILGSGNDRERRIVTVSATYGGADDTVNAEFSYVVKRLERL